MTRALLLSGWSIFIVSQCPNHVLSSYRDTRSLGQWEMRTEFGWPIREQDWGCFSCGEYQGCSQSSDKTNTARSTRHKYTKYSNVFLTRVFMCSIRCFSNNKRENCTFIFSDFISVSFDDLDHFWLKESAFGIWWVCCNLVVSTLTSRVNRNRNSGNEWKMRNAPQSAVSQHVLCSSIRQSTERFADLQLFLAPKSETSAHWDSWTPTEKTSLEASALADYNKDSIEKFYLDDGTKPFYIW